MISVYRIPANRKGDVKKALEAPDMADGDQRVINEFARNGYEFRDASGLGFNEDCSYLYISADEAFFAKNEKAVMADGVEKLAGEEYGKIKKAFEDQLDNAAAGVGAIFGDF